MLAVLFLISLINLHYNNADSFYLLSQQQAGKWTEQRGDDKREEIEEKWLPGDSYKFHFAK